jgi:hypothetical protein
MQGSRKTHANTIHQRRWRVAGFTRCFERRIAAQTAPARIAPCQAVFASELAMTVMVFICCLLLFWYPKYRHLNSYRLKAGRIGDD